MTAERYGAGARSASPPHRSQRTRAKEGLTQPPEPAMLCHHRFLPLSGAARESSRTGAAFMSLTSRLIGRLMKLPPAETHDFIVTRDLRVPMPDGVVLLGDHYAPRSGPKRPTILVRS